MRSLEQRRVDYFTPDVPPVDEKDLPNWLSTQVKNLSDSIHNVNTIHVAKLTHWPEGYKPREGDIIWASEDLISDGTGEGLYVYMNGEWVPFAGSASGGQTPIGGIIMWSGTTAPTHWAICDGTNAPNGMATPDLKNRFVVGFGNNGIGVTGGATVTDWTSLTEDQMPSHSHTIAHDHTMTHTHNIPSHNHTQSGTFTSSGAGGHNHNIIEGRMLVHTGYIYNRSTTAPTAEVYGGQGQTGGYRHADDHEHTVTLSGNTGGASLTTSGASSSTTGGSSNASSGSSGRGESHNHAVEPPYYTLAYIMRYE